MSAVVWLGFVDNIEAINVAYTTSKQRDNGIPLWVARSLAGGLRRRIFFPIHGHIFIFFGLKNAGLQLACRLRKIFPMSSHENIVRIRNDFYSELI